MMMTLILKIPLIDCCLTTLTKIKLLNLVARWLKLMNLQDDKLVGGVSKCLVEVIPTTESPLLLTKMALPQVFFSSPEKKHNILS